MFKKPRSLRLRVLLLVTVAFAVMLGILIYHEVTERSRKSHDARLHLTHTAEKIAAEQKITVAHADQYLLGLMRLRELREIARLTQLKSAPEEACSRFLAGKLKEAPALVGMGVAALNGDVLCNALQPKHPINISDRKYVQEALRTQRLAISDVVVGRANDTLAVNLARVLIDDSETMRGVVWVSLNLVWLQKQLAKADLPEGAHIGLVDASGTIVARYPDEEGWIGRNAADTPLWKSIVIHGGQGTADILGLEGTPRIVAFAPFAETVGGRISLWVSVPRDAITEHLDREFTWTLGVVMALLLLTFAGIWVGGEFMLLRPLSALSDAAWRIAQGDSNACTGLKHSNDEVGRLARSFDDMAETIRAKETKLVRTNKGLRVLSAGNRALLRANDEPELLREMCRAVVEAGAYRMAWVGYAEDDAKRSVRPVAAWGVEAELLDSLSVGWSETERGRGPTGTAIRRGIPILVRDIANDPRVEPWREFARQHGCHSVVSLPVTVNGSVKGALTVCAQEPEAFSDEEVVLLSETASDLAFGIATLRARAERARLEVLAKTSEERFRASAEASLDALFILASVRGEGNEILDFRFTDINPRAEEMLGMKREEVIGQKLCELIPINRTGGFLDKYVAVVTSGRPLEEEFPIDAPQIKAKWLRHQVVRVGDGVAISSRDITAWKTAGDQLRQSEIRYRQLFEANPHPMWVADLATLRFLMVNDAAVQHYGYSRDEFLAMSIADIRPPADVPRLLERVKLVEEGKTNEAGVWRHRKKDGSLIDVEITTHALYLDGRRAEMVLAHDVTAQRRAEAERRRSEQKFKTLFEQAPVGVVIIDLETGMPKEFNDVAHRQLGYSGEEFARLRVSNYEVLESVEQIQAHTQEILRKGGDDFETLHRTKSGELRNVHIMMRVLELAGERLLYCIYQDTTEQRKGEIALRRANRALLTLSAANEELVRATEEETLLHAVCRVIIDKGGSRLATVGFAEDDPGKTIVPVAWAGFEAGYYTQERPTWADTEKGQVPIARAIRSGRTQVARDIQSDPGFAPWRDEALKRGYASNLVMPLSDGARTFGGLSIYSSEADAFDAEETHLLEELANDLAYGIITLRTKAERDRIAYEHQHHEQILRQSLEDSIQAIADTVEARDPYTAGHQRQVADLAAAIAREMGLPEDRIHGIHLAGGVHDLGKIQVPAEILSKPSKLTEIEFLLIKQHPQAGYEILKDISFPWPIATIVWQHHERMDGSGYPQGLKGEEILLESRIMAVADVIEAMASHRPYRPGLGIDRALAEIERGRGTVYDPEVADACLRLFREKRYQLPA